MALSRAHDVLTTESWEGANLVDIVHVAIDPFEADDEGRFDLAGPAVRVTPKQGLALAMALHELSTNAFMSTAEQNQASVAE